jgi:transcriptional regulator with XRE-family HTH domain
MDTGITQAVEKLDEIEKAMAGKELGDEIARLRSKAGWTQEELAQRIGLHQTRVSKLESGEHNYPLETVYRLALAFGVSPFELAAIYWGIEVKELPEKDKEFLNNLLKLFDEYRVDIMPQHYLPINKPQKDISERGDKALTKTTVSRRKRRKRIEKPEDNPQ